MNRAQNLLERVNNSFHWQQKDLKDLEDALLSLNARFDELSENLSLGGGLIPQKQVHIFFEGELRLWDTRDNWESFRKKYNLQEHFDFKIEPEGVVITTPYGEEEDLELFCNLRGEKRCIKHNWMPSFRPKGAIEINVELSCSIGSTTNSIQTPFIPTVDLILAKGYTPTQLRETTGLREAEGVRPFPPRSGCVTPISEELFKPILIDTPPQHAFFPSFAPSTYYNTFYAQKNREKLPTVSIPTSVFNLTMQPFFTFNEINLGGGKELPRHPHIDVVCVRFLKFLQLT